MALLVLVAAALLCLGPSSGRPLNPRERLMEVEGGGDMWSGPCSTCASPPAPTMGMPSPAPPPSMAPSPAPMVAPPPSGSPCMGCPSAPMPPAPPSGSPCAACPSSPSQLCDFYFSGSQGTVPVFNIQGVPSDSGISPVIEYQGAPVEVDSTGPGRVLDCPQGEQGTGASTGDFFYANGQQAVVKARNTQNGIQQFAGKCILLPLHSVQVLPPGSQSPINLNNSGPRCCVVFRTQ